MAGLEELERRATVRLVNYWLSLRRGHGLPAFVDFDPHRNPIPWDQCLLASCGVPDDVVLEHVGAALAAIDLEPAGAPSRSTRSGFVDEILTPLSLALRSHEPQRGSGACRLRGARHLLYRSVLLPFRGLDGERHYVLGAATFKVVPAAPEETKLPDGPVAEEPAGLSPGANARGVPGDAAIPERRHGDP